MNMPNPESNATEQYNRRIGLRLPTTLHAAMAKRAREQGAPVSAIVRTALEREMEAR